ncbi:hypothetical protein XOCgx_0212 [Xanthomonas oryzae pv. oryzicola]|nr:hypothetical protein XOCgx_0212 [Xanthomonas oryzae pv. oryzicola]
MIPVMADDNRHRSFLTVSGLKARQSGEHGRGCQLQSGAIGLQVAATGVSVVAAEPVSGVRRGRHGRRRSVPRVSRRLAGSRPRLFMLRRSAVRLRWGGPVRAMPAGTTAAAARACLLHLSLAGGRAAAAVQIPPGSGGGLPA